MTAEARIQRLRDFSTGERGPYDGIAEDLVCVLEALTIAKLALDLSSPHEKALITDCEKHRAENAQLRKVLGASLQDTERLDWIGAEEAEIDRIDRVETYWFEGVALRDAIDQAMKE